MEFSVEQLEQARKLFAGECKFVLGAASLEQLPESDLPEIAFAGRSNVGKSSLINALVGRKNLVRTSNTPGRTQEINFFNLADKLMLVDLPGYGYAKVSRAKKHAWEGLIKDYLRVRQNLQRVLIMIDSRHGVKVGDEEIMAIMDEAAVPYQLVYTKIDKLRPSEQPAINFDSSRHAALITHYFLTSAEKKTGINQLQAGLAGII